MARDFCCMVALAGERLLLHGGLDHSEKRLDDTWIYDAPRQALFSGTHPAVCRLPLAAPADLDTRCLPVRIVLFWQIWIQASPDACMLPSAAHNTWIQGACW